jgi:hypothetical protein
MVAWLASSSTGPKASDNRPPVIGASAPGRVLYVRNHLYRYVTQDLGSRSIGVVGTMVEERWIHSDGSGAISHRYSGTRPLGARELRLWREAGSPRLAPLAMSTPSSFPLVRLYRVPSGGFFPPLPGSVDRSEPSRLLNGLPRRPRSLRVELERRLATTLKRQASGADVATLVLGLLVYGTPLTTSTTRSLVRVLRDLPHVSANQPNSHELVVQLGPVSGCASYDRLTFRLLTHQLVSSTEFACATSKPVWKHRFFVTTGNVNRIGARPRR